MRRAVVKKKEPPRRWLRRAVVKKEGKKEKARRRRKNWIFKGSAGLVGRRDLRKWIQRPEICLWVGFHAMAAQGRVSCTLGAFQGSLDLPRDDCPDRRGCPRGWRMRQSEAAVFSSPYAKWTQFQTPMRNAPIGNGSFFVALCEMDPIPNAGAPGSTRLTRVWS